MAHVAMHQRLTEQSLGQLSKPPLLYTIGIAHINVEKMEAYVSAIQDALRSEFPGFARHRVESFGITLRTSASNGPSTIPTYC